tara:strand:- start:407 stop:526 length:120 start_codon:yes stop_codon:yes gene_type:complete
MVAIITAAQVVGKDKQDVRFVGGGNQFTTESTEEHREKI